MRFRFSALVFCMLANTVSHAAGTSTISIHQPCSSAEAGAPDNEKLFLHFLSKNVAGGNAEPVCVLRKPILSETPVVSVSVEDSPQGVGALLVIELGEHFRPVIEKMTRNNVRKAIAIVSKNRILSLPFITQPYSDSRILMTTRTKADAEEVAAALR